MTYEGDHFGQCPLLSVLSALGISVCRSISLRVVNQATSEGN